MSPKKRGRPPKEQPTKRDRETPEQVFQRQLPVVRAMLGISQSGLVERLAALWPEKEKAPLDNVKISKIETGKRGVSLNEAIQIAAALGVNPLYLFVPLEDNDIVLIAPRLHRRAGPVRDWVKGALPLRDTDGRNYLSVRPPSELAALQAILAAQQNVFEQALANVKEKDDIDMTNPLGGSVAKEEWRGVHQNPDTEGRQQGIRRGVSGPNREGEIQIIPSKGGGKDVRRRSGDRQSKGRVEGPEIR